MDKNDLETGSATFDKIEPTGAKWMVLKITFLVVLAVLVAETGLMTYVCVILGGIINGDPNYLSSSDPNPQLTQSYAKTMLGFAIPVLIVLFFQCLTGFIGIIKLQIGFLYAFGSLMALSMIISVVEFFMAGGDWWYIPMTSFIIQLLIISIVERMIRMIKEANGR